GLPGRLHLDRRFYGRGRRGVADRVSLFLRARVQRRAVRRVLGAAAGSGAGLGAGRRPRSPLYRVHGRRVADWPSASGDVRVHERWPIGLDGRRWRLEWWRRWGWIRRGLQRRIRGRVLARRGGQREVVTAGISGGSGRRVWR